jgi:hypothetical protein
MADRDRQSAHDAAVSAAIDESLAWTSVLRPLKKVKPQVAASEPTSTSSAQRHPQRQVSDDFHPDGTRFLKCRFFMMGTCAKGAKCHFMHWEPAAAPRKPHVYAASSSSSSSSTSSASASAGKAATLPVTAHPSSTSASASASASAKPSASEAQSPVPISTSVTPLGSKSCATTSTSLADENAHSDESDDEALSAGRAPLPARAPQFDGDSEIDSELYFYGAPGAQPVPAPVARADANNPTATVSFAKMAARNIVLAPTMASKLTAAVTTPASVAVASGDGYASSSTRGGSEFMPFVAPPTVADPQRKPCVYFAQGFCRFGRVCVFIAPCSVSCVYFPARILIINSFIVAYLPISGVSRSPFRVRHMRALPPIVSRQFGRTRRGA